MKIRNSRFSTSKRLNLQIWRNCGLKRAANFGTQPQPTKPASLQIQAALRGKLFERAWLGVQIFKIPDSFSDCQKPNSGSLLPEFYRVASINSRIASSYSATEFQTSHEERISILELGLSNLCSVWEKQEEEPKHRSLVSQSAKAFTSPRNSVSSPTAAPGAEGNANSRSSCAKLGAGTQNSGSRLLPQQRASRLASSERRLQNF